MNKNAYNYKAIRPKSREIMRAALYGNIDLSNENESKIGWHSD